MFVQIIEGRVMAAAALRTQFDHWAAELGVHTPVVTDAGPIQVPALGWIGTTAGISEADEFIAVVRFESEAAARLSNDRPEQGEWWAETARHFEGDVIVHDCADVDILLDGGSDDAGFVTDCARSRQRCRSRANPQRPLGVMVESRPSGCDRRHRGLAWGRRIH